MSKVKSSKESKLIRGMTSGQIRSSLMAATGIDPEEVVRVCREGLNACHYINAGNGQVQTFPDYSTRLNYAKFITETIEGTPIKRQEIVTRQVTTMNELEKKAAVSPAFTRELERLVNRVQSVDADAANVENVEL
jgi:coenzyme F420-reducing hydrogenase delta subunit